ncbi:hypothetical protein [Flavobacterium sp.]|uniref:hypothetical protein n=1 Tax=Flavobacterium sp. TaxID=239 RepID=UPI001212D390|nr:hypothetical protein [Flavobacterium sp.]RZJ71291.1 MAG: hypothetical protein EOO49_11120 [Flavobacterium sp.]
MRVNKIAFLLIFVSGFGQREKMGQTELVDFLNTNTQSKVWMQDSILYFDHSKMKADTLKIADVLPRYHKDKDGKLAKAPFKTEMTKDEILLENDSVVVIRRRKIPVKNLGDQMLKMSDNSEFRNAVVRIDLRKKVLFFANATSDNRKRIQIRPIEEDKGQTYTLLFENPDSKKIASAIYTMKQFARPKQKK